MKWIMENNRESRDEREYRFRLDKGNVQMKEIANIAQLENMEDLVEI